MLKDKIKGTIIGVVIGATLTGGVAMAANTTTLYDVVANGIKIVVDGKKLNPTDAKGNKVEPMIYNGTTYLPVRAVADALGKAVYWDGPNYTVYLGEMDGKLEYPTLKFEDADNISSSDNFKKINGFIDNYGNSYGTALYSNYSHTAEYLLNMKYSTFSGTLCIKKGDSSSDKRIVRFIADDKVIYTTSVLDKTSAPIDFSVNIKGCNYFKIEVEYASNSWGSGLPIYFADAGFYQ